MAASASPAVGAERPHIRVSRNCPGPASLALPTSPWALARGLAQVSWTFDPLVRRNAYFNLAKLGARPRAYLVNFYGPMSDGINAGDDTDRLEAQWRLDDPRVFRASAGEP